MTAAMCELADGVTFWRSRRWPADLHNEKYRQWNRENLTGSLTPGWWHSYQLPRLTSWIATRPYIGSELTSRFTACAPALRSAWQQVCVPHLDSDISTVEWDDIKAFPNEVAKIKPTKIPSAVFTSKFCHFLLPRVFPVMDRTAVGGRSQTYETYFKSVQDNWTDTDRDTQEALIAGLIEAAGVPELFSGFPVINKIVELRMMGRSHPRTQ